MTSAASRAAAKRIEFLLRTFLIVCAEIFTALFMLFIGMYLPSEFQFGSRLAFRLGASGEKRLQVLDKRTVRRLPLLCMCFSLEFRHRVLEWTRRAQP